MSKVDTLCHPVQNRLQITFACWKSWLNSFSFWIRPTKTSQVWHDQDLSMLCKKQVLGKCTTMQPFSSYGVVSIKKYFRVENKTTRSNNQTGICLSRHLTINCSISSDKIWYLFLKKIPVQRLYMSWIGVKVQWWYMIWSMKLWANISKSYCFTKMSSGNIDFNQPYKRVTESFGFNLF